MEKAKPQSWVTSINCSDRTGHKAKLTTLLMTGRLEVMRLPFSGTMRVTTVARQVVVDPRFNRISIAWCLGAK